MEFVIEYYLQNEGSPRFSDRIRAESELEAIHELAAEQELDFEEIKVHKVN